ncbi:MAG: tRNA lysidine(34) synthetase TilS [Myxococcota bacterium]|nr:tRNA lysidine(34) synthetase TilS [Myxococcota bacterium]
MQKELGGWLDIQGIEYKSAVVEIARKEGVELPEDACHWPGKRLVRRARAREAPSRERRNPIRVDEAFDCSFCGNEVPLGGAMVRDHCPWCLCSVHVDVVPGDRNAGCGGIMMPVGFEQSGGTSVLHYRCGTCGHSHRCRAHPDDDRERLIALSAPRTRESRLEIEVMDLVQRVRNFGESHKLFEPGPLAVAVSGGVDSMVLMHIMAQMGLKPTVLSVDHGLRAESVDEVRRVGDMAEELGLPFVSHRLALELGPNVAQRARTARYAWLDSLDFPTIALGHHRDDQAETVLDRLARGAGSAGLGAMSPRRGRYVRPMLRESRKLIETWAGLRHLRWVEDPSNREGTRGVIRHKVLPVLTEVRAGAVGAMARSAELVAEDDRYLQELAAPLLAEDGIVLEAWQNAASPLRRRSVQQLVRLARGQSKDLSAVQLDALEKMQRAGSWIPLPGGWRLVRDTERIRCLPDPPAPACIEDGLWGIWRIRCDQPVETRSILPGERLDGTPLRERLRVAGISPGLRPYHPVVVVGERRWLPGVCIENPEAVGTTMVSCELTGSPSVAPGGPWKAAL